jgi:hypothetical protein
MFSACESMDTMEREDVGDESEGVKEIVMHVGGIAWSYEDSGICDAPSNVSRRDAAARDAAARALEANGEAMKELWVFDVIGNSCALICKQTDVDDNFGSVSMKLSYGNHRLAVVCSRGEGSDVDVSNGRIAWERVRDTFWNLVDCDVAKTGNTNISVTLKRVAARMRVTVNDVIPSDLKTISISGEPWYKGIDVKTGEAIGELSSVEGVTDVSSLAVPSAYVGTEKKLAVSLWIMSKGNEWAENVTVKMLDDNGDMLSQSLCNGVPMQRNRVTNVAGYFLSGGASGNIILDDSWSDTYQFDF